MGNKLPVFNGRIPTDIVKIILLNVDPFTVRNLARVCKQFWNITKDKAFYLSKLTRDFPEFAMDCDPKECYLCLCMFFSEYKGVLNFVKSNDNILMLFRKDTRFFGKPHVDNVLTNVCYNLGISISWTTSYKRGAPTNDLHIDDKYIDDIRYDLRKYDMFINEERLKAIKKSLTKIDDHEKYKQWKTDKKYNDYCYSEYKAHKQHKQYKKWKKTQKYNDDCSSECKEYKPCRKK